MSGRLHLGLDKSSTILLVFSSSSIFFSSFHLPALNNLPTQPSQNRSKPTTMMQSTQDVAILQTPCQYGLLDLPNEFFLQVVAHVPLKDHNALKLVNQLFNLMTDAVEIQEFRENVARNQFQHYLAFCTSNGIPPWIELQEMDEETAIVNEILSGIQAVPTRENTADPIDDETHMLRIGLHLFSAISRLGIRKPSEYERALFLTTLGAPIAALLRHTSTRATKVLLEYASSIGSEATTAPLRSSLAPAAVETIIVRNGIGAITDPLSSETAYDCDG